MSWAAVGVAAVGATEAIIGGVKAHKAKKKAEELAQQRPKYSVSPYAKDELNLAESQVATGMSADARAAYEQETDRDLSASLDAILKGGGSVNNVGEVFGQSQVGRQRFAAMKENLRLANINNLMSAYKNMTEQGDKQFEFNQWAPYADAAQATAAERKSGQDMLWSGINNAAGSIGGVVGGVSGMFKGGGGTKVNTSALPSSEISAGPNLPTGGFNSGPAAALSAPTVGNNGMPDLNLYNFAGPIT